jgi:type IV secretory pathway TrbD component
MGSDQVDTTSSGPRAADTGRRGITRKTTQPELPLPTPVDEVVQIVVLNGLLSGIVHFALNRFLLPGFGLQFRFYRFWARMVR